MNTLRLVAFGIVFLIWGLGCQTPNKATHSVGPGANRGKVENPSSRSVASLIRNVHLIGDSHTLGYFGFKRNNGASLAERLKKANCERTLTGTGYCGAWASHYTNGGVNMCGFLEQTPSGLFETPSNPKTALPLYERWIQIELAKDPSSLPRDEKLKSIYWLPREKVERDLFVKRIPPFDLVMKYEFVQQGLLPDILIIALGSNAPWYLSVPEEVNDLRELVRMSLTTGGRCVIVGPPDCNPLCNSKNCLKCDPAGLRVTDKSMSLDASLLGCDYISSLQHRPSSASDRIHFLPAEAAAWSGYVFNELARRGYVSSDVSDECRAKSGSGQN